MRAVRKLPFVLLEILIALSLFSTLLAFLLGSFYNWSKLEKETQDLLNSVEEETLLYSKFQRLFTHLLCVDKIMEKEEPTFFYTEPPLPGITRCQSLIFSYDNFLEHSPIYSSSQLVRLFVDPQNNLRLTFWPILQKKCRDLSRSEILKAGVEKMEFSFFVPKIERDWYEKITVGNRPAPGLHKEWQSEWQTLPLIVWITLHFVDAPTRKWGFALPQSKRPLLFPVEQSPES